MYAYIYIYNIYIYMCVCVGRLLRHKDSTNIVFPTAIRVLSIVTVSCVVHIVPVLVVKKCFSISANLQHVAPVRRCHCATTYPAITNDVRTIRSSCKLMTYVDGDTSN